MQLRRSYATIWNVLSRSKLHRWVARCQNVKIPGGRTLFLLPPIALPICRFCGLSLVISTYFCEFYTFRIKYWSENAVGKSYGENKKFCPPPGREFAKILGIFLSVWYLRSPKAIFLVNLAPPIGKNALAHALFLLLEIYCGVVVDFVPPPGTGPRDRLLEFFT